MHWFMQSTSSGLRNFTVHTIYLAPAGNAIHVAKRPMGKGPIGSLSALARNFNSTKIPNKKKSTQNRCARKYHKRKQQKTHEQRINLVYAPRICINRIKYLVRSSNAHTSHFTPHSSKMATTTKSRRAYTMHIFNETSPPPPPPQHQTPRPPPTASRKRKKEKKVQSPTGHLRLVG